ncbi:MULTISPECIES: EAL domain-containing protein [unclassified Pseudomonas]|uniref:sensor domain-containing diguanylate cyclase n=1 Tax=unclassified Pseudomonas TaxID=196821 RepID=UPI001F590129|nr:MULTISPECIES: EAL domain-containing protein [unclassified Pseudomonas]
MTTANIEHKLNPLKSVEDLYRVQGVDQGDPSFDDIFAIASELFNAQISLISITHRYGQCFAAGTGFDIQNTAREISFCSSSLLLNKETVEILDTQSDERFKDNPMVTGPPFIRYYAGAPLLTDDGYLLGDLCVIGASPRTAMSEKDRTLLTLLARNATMRLLEFRSRNVIDHPSGLFNRLKFEEDIQQEITAGGHIQIYAIDIICPQSLNDMIKTRGYKFAHDLLKIVQNHLQLILPTRCILYKISSTRFGFMLKKDRPAELICSKILGRFKDPIACHGLLISIQLGIGVLPLTNLEAADGVRLVVCTADDARERSVGWAMYIPGLDAAQQRSFMIRSSIAGAVKSDNQLSLVYHPKVSLPSHCCDSVEALIRWDHPQFGAISPIEFIPLAGKTDLIRSISLWVLDKVVSQISLWKLQGLQLRIAMNVTVADFENSTFVDRLASYITNNLLDASLIELEFTESMLMSEPVSVTQQLTRVRNLEIKIAIDDFGTGYSNWTYLQQLPINTIKLDKSLIAGLGINEQNRQLVKTLIELCAHLGYRIVAEGVESHDDLYSIEHWGCTEAQGYLISAPLDAHSLVEWLRGGGFSSCP